MRESAFCFSSKKNGLGYRLLCAATEADVYVDGTHWPVSQSKYSINTSISSNSIISPPLCPATGPLLPLEAIAEAIMICVDMVDSLLQPITAASFGLIVISATAFDMWRAVTPPEAYFGRHLSRLSGRYLVKNYLFL